MTRCKDCDKCGMHVLLNFYPKYGCYLCKECKKKRDANEGAPSALIISV